MSGELERSAASVQAFSLSSSVQSGSLRPVARDSDSCQG